MRGRNRCKAGRAAYHRAYYEAHKQQVIERAAAWGKTPQGQAAHEAYRAAHKAEKATYDRAYRAAHAERIGAYMATYRAAHRPRLLEAKRVWYHAHAEQSKARTIAWQRAHPVEHRARVDRYAARNPLVRAVCKHNRRSRAQAAEGSFTPQDIRDIYAAQRGRCAYCWQDLLHRYHIDHMMPLSRGGCNNASNLALCCAPCNLKKATRSAGEWFALVMRDALS